MCCDGERPRDNLRADESLKSGYSFPWYEEASTRKEEDIGVRNRARENPGGATICARLD